jgi:hypothetical protein
MIPLASVAFDIDGVVADTMNLFIEIAREDYNISIQYEQINNYDLTQCLDIEFEIVWDIFKQIMKGHHSQPLKPIYKAPEILQKLGQKTKRLLFVTARSDANALVPWFLETLQLPESKFKIEATGDFQQKIAVLMAHDVTYLIDDRMETCRLLNEHGLKPIVFHQPWNREPHPFIEVRNWDEIYELIDK